MSHTVQTSAPAAFLDGIPRPKSPVEVSAADPSVRWVPALIGTADDHQVVYVECPRWCTEDHMAEPGSLDDITHLSDPTTVDVTTFLGEAGRGRAAALAYVLHARIEADPVSAIPQRRQAHVIVWEDASAIAAQLNADMADELADDLVGFAAQLRHLARAVRVANHENPAERAA